MSHRRDGIYVRGGTGTVFVNLSYVTAPADLAGLADEVEAALATQYTVHRDHVRDDAGQCIRFIVSQREEGS